MEYSFATIACLLGPAWRLDGEQKRKSTGAKLNLSFEPANNCVRLIGRDQLVPTLSWNPAKEDLSALCPFEGKIRLQMPSESSDQRRLLVSLPPTVVALADGISFEEGRPGLPKTARRKPIPAIPAVATVVKDQPTTPVVTPVPLTVVTRVPPAPEVPSAPSELEQPSSSPVQSLPIGGANFESPQDELAFLLGTEPGKKKGKKDKKEKGGNGKKHRKAA